MAQLAATVYVRDPESHQTVELAQGTSPEARLAALVPNPGAWVDGKLPRAATAAQDDSGTGQDDAPGADSDTGKPSATKPAARKSAATKPARGRGAADEGTSGD